MAPGFKVAKDQVIVMLGGNATEDYKLKPAVIYSTTLRILEHRGDFSTLPFLFTGGL
jgi:hypothetical protein